MQYMLECLTPVHIGTGNRIEPSDYLLEGDQYIRVNMENFIRRLEPVQADRLAEWAGQLADRIAGERDNRRQSEMRLELNPRNFARNEPGLTEALLQDKDLSLYRARTGMRRPLAVQEQEKDADGSPSVPGSSIKGALRTALMYAALTDMSEAEQQTVVEGTRDGISGLRRILDEAERARGRQKRRLAERIGQELEKLIFRCRGRSGSRAYGDIQYDLMRLISVSDTMEQGGELLVPSISTFTEKRSRDGRTSLGPALDILAETHAPGNRFAIRITVDGQLAAGLVRQRNAREWEGLEPRMTRAFGRAAWQALNSGDVTGFEDAVLARIHDSARRFGKAIVNAELEWSRGYPEAKAIGEIYQKIQALSSSVTLLRLGWGSQFTATTVLLALKAVPAWNTVMERVIQAFDLGLPPGARGQGKATLGGFPRSRRLVAEGRRATAPMGWVAISADSAALPGALVEPSELVRGGGNDRSERAPDRGAARSRGQGRSDRRDDRRRSAPPPPVQAGPRPGDQVEVVVMEEKTKKGGWKFKIKDSDQEAVLHPGSGVPEGIAPGKEGTVKIRATGKTFQVEWLEAGSE